MKAVNVFMKIYRPVKSLKLRKCTGRRIATSINKIVQTQTQVYFANKRGIGGKK